MKKLLSRSLSRSLLGWLVGLLSLVASAAQAESHGAISYSPSTGSFGGSWNYSSTDDAKNASVGRCGQADCFPVVWVESNCAALAVGDNRSLYGWAWNSDSGLARWSALQRCSEQDTGCQILDSICSF
jgi:serine/threonine-protein kinase